ncbi:MAG TPA: hypothetical protein VKQ36_00185 [Ktedonobacterales bacterium]|nr:hypothetical protein [Ktedonobacterales bacterium]
MEDATVTTQVVTENPAKSPQAADPLADAEAGATGMNGVISVVSAEIDALATVGTSLTHTAMKRVYPAANSWRIRLARTLGWPLGSFSAFVVGMALLAPPLALLAGVVWTVITSMQAVITLVGLLYAHQYSQLVMPLSALDSASRITFAAVSYSALLGALIVLMAGLLGRRWARLFLASGALFTIAALLGCMVGFLLLAPLAAHVGLSQRETLGLGIYALLDAIILGAMLCDLRPGKGEGEVHPRSGGTR